MKKAVSRICALICAFVVGALFTGCALFEQNLDHDYFRIVATVKYNDNEIIKITKKELFDTYNSYGYQYVSSYGYTLEEAYKKTLDALIDREALIKISVENFGIGDGAGVFGFLTFYEADTARKNAFDSLNSAVKQYIDEINGTESETEAETDPETDDTAVKYTPYEKTISVSPDNGEFSLNLSSYSDVTDIGFVPSLWSPDIPVGTDSKTVAKALARIVRNLETRENGFVDLINSDNNDKKNHKGEEWGWFVNGSSKLKNGYGSPTDNGNKLINENLDGDEQEVLNREILRMVKSNEKSIVTARLSNCFNLGLTGKSGFEIYMNRGNDFGAFESAVKDSGVAVSSGDYAVTTYKNLVKQAINDYNNNPPSDLEADLISSVSGVYYVPTAIADNLFTVSHILVGFTDAQTARYTEITALAETDSSFNKETALQQLYAETMSNGKNVYDIYNEIKSSIDSAETLNSKYITFRDLIYKYNTDPGMQNPEFEYVMSTNTDKNKMIPEFTAASIELKNTGVKGAVSGIVWGSYGAHIIMYTRDLGDFIYSSADYLLNTAYEKTLFAPQTAYGEKTIFDTLLPTRSYENYEKALMKQYKSDKIIETNTSVYKNLYK